MYWVVGMTVGVQDTAVPVYPASLNQHGWESAAEFAIEMTQSQYPDLTVELDYVKEYD